MLSNCISIVHWKNNNKLVKVEVIAELPYATIPNDDGERIFKIKYNGEFVYVYKRELQFI